MYNINREENIPRLKSHIVPIDNPNYLVYESFHYELLKCINKYTKGRLLDIGCGNKPYFDIAYSLTDEYIGCDIIQSSENKVDIICDACDLPFDNSSFDTILLTQVIEHISDFHKVIDESFRVLKHGGHLIISGPQYWPLHEEPFDYYRFTKYGFEYFLTKSGFNLKETLSNGGKWALCGQALLHALYPEINLNKTVKWRIFRKI
jgi:SAM-dependent methyltransferase